LGDSAADFAVTSIETRASWFVAVTVLTVMSFAFGAPFISVVALKQIAAELGSARSVPALGYSLAWFGSGVGGIVMGRVAERVGTRWTVAFGAAMIGVGLVVSTEHSMWSLWLGHGLFIGLLGIGGINAPCYVYVSRWFDSHRGTALALISSGQYVAGTIWPLLFERGIAQLGWRETMLIFAAAVVVVVVPLALLILRDPPELPVSAATAARDRSGASVLGLPPNLTLGLLAAAAFMCCVPMAMPPSHLVAYCSDLGIAPAQGAAMLSVLLGCAFSPGRCGAGSPIVSAGCGPCCAARSARSWRWLAFCWRMTRPACSPWRHSSAWASPAWCRPTCSRFGNCFPPRRPRGASRRCCCSAARGWRLVAGWPVSSMTGSGSTAWRSEPALWSTWAT
jgi:MFS family permease